MGTRRARTWLGLLAAGAALSGVLAAPSSAVGASARLAVPARAPAPSVRLPLPAAPATAPSWPVSVSGDGRWVLDQSGKRWQMLADSGWHLNTLSDADMLTYYDGLSAAGFNATEAMLPNNMWSRHPADNAGRLPFTGTAFRSAPNEPYWAHVDWLLDQAAARGITIIFAPAYAGYFEEGWMGDLQAASPQEAQDYGAYLGNRYKSRPNIIWMLGGDRLFNEGDLIYDRYASIAAGLTAAGDTHLVTGHPAGQRRTTQQWPASATYVDLNGVYENQDANPAIVDQVSAGWNDTPVRPVFMLESSFENEGWRGHISTPLELRYQSWGSWVAGGFGALFGNNPRWHFDDPSWYWPTSNVWRLSLSDPAGVQDQGTRHQAMFSRTVFQPGWADTNPDTTDTFLTGGELTGTSRAGARFSTTRGLVYAPNARPITLDLTELAAGGATTTITRVDPTNGAASVLGNYPTTGSRTIPAQGTNAGGDTDWVFTATPPAPAADGHLRVTTKPAVPARIVVDGVPRADWGLDWMPIAPGSHQVCFTDVPGFTTPPCSTVQVTGGQTTTLEGAFGALGLLKVDAAPAGIPTTVFVDGTPRDEYGLYSYLEPGPHQVCWGDVPGYRAPACSTVTVAAAATATVTGTFVADPAPPPGPAPALGDYGFLRVTTDPPVVSRVVVDGIARADWGLSWVKFPVGQHQLCFTQVPGFTAPACRSISVTSGATTTVAGTFQPLGLLRVTVRPAGLPVGVSVGGTVRNKYGLYAWFEPGAHTVCGSAVAGYATPACAPVTVTAGATADVTLTYAPA